jgi:phage terminase small subunit
MGKRGPKSFAEKSTSLSVIRPMSAYNRLTIPHPPAPNHLQLQTQAWWDTVVSSFEIRPHQLQTLQVAGEAWDRKEEARAALKQHGLTYTDAKDMIRARPEVQIERDSRVAYPRAVRELALEVPPPHPYDRFGNPVIRRR